jgi:CO/xanthine dehydrogenase Mo-binding subunit
MPDDQKIGRDVALRKRRIEENRKMEEEYKPWLWKAPEGGVIGKRRVRRVDGYEKASGSAVYVRDVYRPGMLYGKLYLSPYAHATIKRMDTKRAESLVGVRAVLRYDDPEEIGVRPFTGTEFGTHNMLPGTAHYFGQPVGALVVADSEAICDQALRLIEFEWEELPIILDWEEALKPGAPLLRPDLNAKNNLNSETLIKYGDVDKGLKESAKTISFKMTDEEDNSTVVEAHACVAEWKGDYLEVWYHGQSPNKALQTLSAAGYANQDKITINTAYMGAQYGGLNWSKSIGNASGFTTYAVAAARRTRRPVKVLWDESHFHGGEETNGSYVFTVGFEPDGRVRAIKAELLWASQMMHATLGKLHEGTSVPHLYSREIVPYLSRGFNPCAKDGGPATAPPNLVFSQVAAALGMDPTKVAQLNDGCEGQPMAEFTKIKAEQGFNPEFDSLRKCIEAGKKAIDWDNKWHAPASRILPNGNYHGLGFIWTIAWRHQPGPSTIGVMMRPDGTANILARTCDIGVSSPTACIQLVADELGLSYEDVTWRHDKDVKFSVTEISGSMGSTRTFPAMIRAARNLRKIILEHAVIPSAGGLMRKPEPAAFPNSKPENLRLEKGMIFDKANPSKKIKVVDVIGPFYDGINSPFFAWDFPPYVSRDIRMHVFARQCYFTEVEVDPETGLVEVTKHVVVNDIGKAINPDSINGQQYGGSYMGIGRSNTEAIYYDPKTGVKLNDNHIGYEILTMNDVGPIDCHILESGFGYAPYGIYGIGESSAACTTTVTAPAIYNAIGKWVTDFPTTPDKILKALGKI